MNTDCRPQWLKFIILNSDEVQAFKDIATTFGSYCMGELHGGIADDGGHHFVAARVWVLTTVFVGIEKIHRGRL